MGASLTVNQTEVPIAQTIIVLLLMKTYSMDKEQSLMRL